MSLRVLLADESSSIKKVFQLGLQDFSAEVKSVHSGLDVIEVALAFRPDIIFVDILLQKVNGYSVSERCRKHPRLKDIPVVLMWSSFMELDQEKFKACGASGEIEKPFEVETMRSLVRTLVPSLGDQNIASFLKFPNSITHDFVEEEKLRKESPPQTDTFGALTITPASQEPIFEPNMTTDTSLFNSPDFEIETPEEAPEEEVQLNRDNLDISSWAVDSETSDETTAVLDEDDDWQITQLPSETPPSAPDTNPEEFRSFELGSAIEIKPSIPEDPLDPEAKISPEEFLYKPSVNKPASSIEEPPPIHGDTFNDLENIESIEKVVEQKVMEYIQSDKIDHLVRSHVQDLIQKRVSENMNKVIEKVAREELEKLLAEEISENVNPNSSPS